MAFLLQRLARSFGMSTASILPPVESMALPAGSQQAIFAAGCFWGVEHLYRKHFPLNTAGGGLYDCRVGYIGGATSSPSYRAVCSGDTGHAEAVRIIFDPEKVKYQELVEFFYRMHDPTTKDRQGPDRGSQYRSGIYYTDDEQKKVAEDVTAQVQAKWWKDGKIVTEITKAGEWWDAEVYHQLYLHNNPSGYECPSQ
jgi:peptide-methionine (S)-S-oxide reductase